MKVAIVRGAFLNQYEMQSFEPLTDRFDLTGFASLKPFHDRFAFPVIKLPCPMDLPNFPYNMPILNRLFIDAHYLLGLEEKLKGFDIVHSAETYFHYTQQCLNAKRKGYVKKVIVTVLENIPYNNEGIRGRKAFKKRAREELDHIIALTDKTKEALLAEGCDPSKITVIGHGIRTDRFVPHKKRPLDKKITILFSGRLEAEKGVYEVLQAARMLLQDISVSRFKLKFLFVGDGSQKQQLLKLEKDWGIASHVFHRQLPYEAMPSAYEQADIFVAPSKPRIVVVRGEPTPTWDEQYCTVLLEAQAAGLPIVTTHTGGIPENVGGAALLVAPGDAHALAQAIKRFIVHSKLRARYAKSARHRALTVHDAAIISKKIAAVYKKVLCQ